MPRHPGHRVALSTIGVAAGLLWLTAALAQAPMRPPDSNGFVPQDAAPDQSEPQDPRSTGSICRGDTLSERLERCGGVIPPPRGIAPDNTIRPPDPGTTPVIPPPGSPGGNQDVDPKG
jgi:hypothetical protein